MKQVITLSSQQLLSPQLRFDYASRAQVSELAFDGFKRWGPYDKNQPRNPSVNFAIIYPSWAMQEMNNVREAFQRGMHFFRGFQQFSHGIKISCFDPISINVTEDMSLVSQSVIYQNAIISLDERQYNLVFVIIPFSPRYILESPYYVAKTELSAKGIPCQLLTIQKLRNDEIFKWSLANIALQTYSKLGYIPWVVETNDQPNDLIIGIGQRIIRSNRIGQTKRFMGYTTAYQNNGAFLTFQGISGIDQKDNYCEQLSQSVSGGISAFHANQTGQGLPLADPDRVIIHSFKKVSDIEINAVEEGIKGCTQNHNLIPYALLHIDGSSNFLTFDNDHRTYLPKMGLSVWLGPLQALLLTEGRERYERQKMGFPSPLKIQMDSRSKLNEDLADAIPNLIHQIYDLSKVNWRGFNAAAVPITLSYSKLIAELIASCQDPELWEKIANAPTLRNKAWFL
jgi:hypothetical protein